MRKLFNIDPELGAGGKRVVIIGTGRMALLAHTALIQEGVPVAAFCDLSGRHAGEQIMGRPVITVDELVGQGDADLVYAGENPQNAKRDVESLGSERAWIDLHAYGIVNDCIWSFM